MQDEYEMTVEEPGTDWGDNEWVKLAHDAYTNSTDYFDANVRRQIEKNIAMFRSQHPSGSKYHTDAYKHRSKLFRPKTRGAIRRSEAAVAVALFSTHEAVTVVPENPSDETQRASAAVFDALMNVRLTRTIPWFLTAVGAFQDAKVSGICISKQYWDYEEKVHQQAVMATGFLGEPVFNEQGDPQIEILETVERIRDRPWVDLIPVENFRFSPAADWRNPIETSPYVINIVPMFLGDVKERMNQGRWIPYSDAELMQSGSESHNSDPTRAARTGNRADPTDASYAENEFNTVWCHENFIRRNGETLVYWTLGTRKLLSSPRPLQEAYHHGVIPFVVGMAEIESHRIYPPGDPELSEGLQVEANDTVNQRIDNIRLILNKRYKVRRGSDVDMTMLKRSIPGGIIPMSNLADVEPEQVTDVTSSSYHEQDRINADFDDLVGSFASGSVATNRQLNETVGGMQMMQGAANSLVDFSIRVFVETWVEPVVRQLLLLEKAYEDDQTLLAVAGEKAKLAKRFGVDRVTDEILRAQLATEINVGFGATNPDERINRLSMGLNAVAQFAPMALQKLNAEEVVSELFGALGYKDGTRFFRFNEEQGPSAEEMQAELEQAHQLIQELQMKAQGHELRAQAMVHGKQIDAEARMAIEQLRGQRAESLEHLRGQYRLELEGLKSQLEAVDKQIKGASLQLDRGKLELQREALRHQITRAEAEMREKIREFDTSAASNPITQGPIGPDTGALKGVIQRDRYGMIPGTVG
jgi:hypothetical protein